MARNMRFGSTQQRTVMSKLLIRCTGLIAAQYATPLFVSLMGSSLSSSRLSSVSMRQQLQEEAILGLSDDGTKFVGFGKHRDSTYADVLADDPEYCQWILGETTTGEASCGVMEFAEYIQRAQPDLRPRSVSVSNSAVDTVSVGKYMGKPYSEVVMEDPDYCQYILECEDPGQGIMPFYEWLQSNKDVLEQAKEMQNGGAAGTVKFGRYSGRTFEEVLKEDPDYCQWVLKMEDPGVRMIAFIKWLETQDMPKTSIVTFGKYSGMAFEEVLKEDPHYCQWLLTEVAEPGSRTGPFVEWLQTQDMAAIAKAAGETMDFGKYKGRSYEEVHQEDLDYCQWVVDKEFDDDLSRGMRSFIEWLKVRAQQEEEEDA